MWRGGPRGEPWIPSAGVRTTAETAALTAKLLAVRGEADPARLEHAAVLADLRVANAALGLPPPPLILQMTFSQTGSSRIVHGELLHTNSAAAELTNRRCILASCH